MAKTLDGLLKSQLQLAAPIHLREQLLILRFERDVHPGAQQVDSAVDSS